MTQEKTNHSKPLIPANMKLSEITLKAIITAICLTILLAASNAYLALKVGQTVAASIPAAVISMGLFRFFKRSNVLEINLVQTAASAGEALAGVSAFILPALIILGFWHGFNFFQTMILILFGGTLGVLFAVPLRRVLLNLKALHFPEGTAIGNVLKASVSGGAQLKHLVEGSIVGGVIVLCQSGFQFLADHLPLWFRTEKSLFGISLGFNSALIGAGYIIGMAASLAILLGIILAWVFGVPILSFIYGVPSGASPEDMALSLWSQHIRYIGVGAMMVAGIWTLITLINPITKGLITAYKSTVKAHLLANNKMIRTERDIPLNIVLGGIALMTIIGLLIVWYSIMSSGLVISGNLILFLTLLSILYILIFGFISSVICGYLVGLVGSTNTPMSAILIINVLLMAIILLPLIGIQGHLTTLPQQQNAAMAMVIFVVAIVGFAGIITNENIQDLKAGRMVGATPWKQQLMMVLGVIVASVIITPVLDLLFKAYGMGGVFPRPNMNAAQMLPAPQAGLLAATAKGVLTHQLPWPMLITGGALGIVGIFIDEYLRRKKGLRLPVLAMGFGIYIPPMNTTPIIIGGLIEFLATRAAVKKGKTTEKIAAKTFANNSRQSAIILACGLVAGSALMGVILAIPFVLKGNSDALKLISNKFQPIAEISSLIVTIFLGVWLYRTAIGAKKLLGK